MPYKHGIENETTATAAEATTPGAAVQVVIGTAPVHLLSNPAAATNKPILCSNIEDCKTKIGYSKDFEKYSLCQSMYYNFEVKQSNTPIVFINVLDTGKHATAVTAVTKQINNNSFTIEDSVIVSTLAITVGEETVAATDYETEWINGKLIINFKENTTGTATVGYSKLDAAKVTANDIVGAWTEATDTRTGAEVIKTIYPTLGVIPFLITAPGFSKDDTVCAILKSKAAKINGCYKAMVIADLDTTTTRTRAAAIAAKQERALDENCIICYPMIKKGGNIISLSVVISALIMEMAAAKDGMTCDSPSNKSINIDDVVLADGTSVFYDTEDGNELNAEGILTVISRNGWYAWGNNTAAYPGETDPVKRFIMTRLSFLWTENDFIDRYFSVIDEALDGKTIENCVTDYNIILASRATAGYIAAGKIYFNAGDNPRSEILAGHFTFQTALAANIPTEYIKNIFSFDKEGLENSIFGGEQ